ARAIAGAFSLAYGMQPPAISIVDQDAPNALVFGRRSSGQLALTTGALDLPSRSLESLVAFHISALNSRAYAYATSAVDLTLLGEWLTNLLWASCAFVIFSTVIGVPVQVAAIYVVAVAVVVLATRPAIAFAARELVALLVDIDELIDLET